jgi:hypothetical protein
MELYLNVLANVLGAVAIALSTWAYIISKREAIYGDLDSLYLEVLKIGLESPQFRNIKYTSDYTKMFESENERIAYETYAYITFNWCETVLDKARQDTELKVTWYPAVRAEYQLHKAWIENPENHFKFKEEYRSLLKSSFSI